MPGVNEPVIVVVLVVFVVLAVELAPEANTELGLELEDEVDWEGGLATVETTAAVGGPEGLGPGGPGGPGKLRLVVGGKGVRIGGEVGEVKVKVEVEVEVVPAAAAAVEVDLEMEVEVMAAVVVVVVKVPPLLIWLLNCPGRGGPEPGRPVSDISLAPAVLAPPGNSLGPSLGPSLLGSCSWVPSA